MAVKLNFSNVSYCCRTCMTGNTILLNIFEDSLNCVSIVEILTSCTSVNINKNDALPKRICQICYEKLHSFHEFKISVEEVDAKFRKLLEDETHFGCDKKDNIDIKVDNNFLLDESETVNVKVENQDHINSICETHNVFVFEGNTCNDIETHNTNNAHKLEPNQKAEYNNKIYICEICKKIFKNHHNYLKHCKKHTYNNNKKLNKMINDKVFKNRTIKCDVCASVFKTLETLSAHMKVHGNDKELTCVINLEDQKNDNLLSTVSENVGEFQCKVCKDQFRSKNSLSAHMRKHVQKGRVLACSVCGKIFSKISHLKRHEYSHEVKHRFRCSICKTLFPTKESLQEHSKQHKDAKPLVCPVCQKAFFHMASLNTHIKVHTRDKLYLCPFCGKRFDSSTNLNQHIRRHIGIKAFSCSLCPRKFVSKGELKSHNITHTGERTYKCGRCNAAFTKHSSLTQHNLRHLGVKPHQCDTCRMKFVSKSQLTRHYRIHTGEKPYRCDMCERAYTQSNDLAKHRRGHLGEKIYKCNECSEGFRLKAELQQHISQHYVSQMGEQKNDLTTKDNIQGLSSS